jgi:hypothetical protein
MANKTKLDELYSLRENFTIIGLTGRTGSGCSDSRASIFYKFAKNHHCKNIQTSKF